MLQQGEEQVRVQHSDFSLEPRSDPARSLGNLHQHLIKIPSCFQGSYEPSLSFNPPLGLKFPFFLRVPWGRLKQGMSISDRLGLRIVQRSILSSAFQSFTHWHLAKVPMIGPVGMMQKRLYRIDQIQTIRF